MTPHQDPFEQWLKEGFKEMGNAKPSGDFTAQLMAKIAPPKPKIVYRPLIGKKSIWLAAALLLLACGFDLLTAPPSKSPAQPMLDLSFLASDYVFFGALLSATLCIAAWFDRFLGQRKQDLSA